MTGTTLTLRRAAPQARAHLKDAFKEILEMIDLPIEGLVVMLSWAGLMVARKRRPGKRKERPLQIIRAMSMVNDHVLRDVGLDRSAIGAISELSAEDVHGCRIERQVA